MSPPRGIRAIAADIQRDWQRVYWEARPALRSMHELRTLRDTHLGRSADTIIREFLHHAMSWRGDVARRLKGELRRLIGWRREYKPRAR